MLHIHTQLLYNTIDTCTLPNHAEAKMVRYVVQEPLGTPFCHFVLHGPLTNFSKSDRSFVVSNFCFLVNPVSCSFSYTQERTSKIVSPPPPTSLHPARNFDINVYSGKSAFWTVNFLNAVPIFYREKGIWE